MANKKGNKGLAKGMSEEAALRRPKSLDMRIGGLSYRDIGRQLGVSYETARIDVKTILKETLDKASEEAEELRQIEAERLDILWNKWFAKAIGNKELKIAPDKDAALRCLQIMKRRAELLGLDAPQKTAFTDPSGEKEAKGIIYIPQEDELETTSGSSD